MSSLRILFLVTLSIIGPLTTAESSKNKAIDLNTVLNFLQQLKESSSSTSDTDDDSGEYFTEIDNAGNNRNEILEKKRIIDLIEKVAKENNNEVEDNDRITYRKEKPDSDQLKQNDKVDDAFDDNIQTQILAKLLSQDLNEESKAKSRLDSSKNRLKPSRLQSTVTVSEVNTRNNDDVTGLENYSKIYVVLNPQAVEKSKNKNAFNELISKILSLSSLTSKKDNQGKRKPRRYKGFVVKEEMAQRRFRQAMAERARRNAMGNRYYQNRRMRKNGAYYVGHTAAPYK